MNTNFSVGDKVKIIGGPEEAIGKTGAIVKDGGEPNIAVGFRKLGEGIKSVKSGHHLWVIMLDETYDTIVLPEDNLETISQALK